MTNQFWLTVQPGISITKEPRPKLSSDTREKIIKSAFTVLSRQGYENTSIKDIAEEAGVAQGLVHYYFKSKQQLVMAVLLDVCQKMDVYSAEGEAGATAAFENFKALLRTRPDAHTLYIQLIGVGLHDNEIGAGIRENIKQERGRVENLARQVLAQREADPGPARAIAGAVWAGVIGIMVQKMVDPEFNADEAVDALAAMSLSAVFSTNQGAQAPA
ncbi:MAG TPA: TetR/AcrR family transcriptional regulator [Candidatus Dormibacteraeota bacterium]|jgi:AcrR family transcriptional regulator|nr:TetR/AcrR family transcriptional regulator [Candidatus Dormibacteraeota bacterium]